MFGFELAFLILFVMVAMAKMNSSKFTYSCSQCGSKNGEHAKHCSFRKFDEK